MSLPSSLIAPRQRTTALREHRPIPIGSHTSLLSVCILAAMAAPKSAPAATLAGHVYSDADGDGVFSTGERGVAGAVVWWESSVHTRCDDRGRFRLDVPDDAAGIVWVQIPDGYEPAPVFAAVNGDAGGSRTALDLGLTPSSATGPMTFIVAADTHLGRGKVGRDGALDADDLRRVLSQATGLLREPRFFVIAGDMAQSGDPEQFAAVVEVAKQTGVPFVPVAGNHDWLDGGATYRSLLGPPNYSFDAGGAHFVILNDSDEDRTWEPFLARDLTLVAPGTPVIAFTHRPPRDADLAILDGAGVGTLFTGHWHSNNIFEYRALTQYNTEPLIRGGIDTTPAGYRSITLDGDKLIVQHHTTVERPVVAIAHPRPGECISADTVQVIAAVMLDVGSPEVMLSRGRKPWQTMRPAGGWAFTAEIELPAEEPSEIRVRVRGRDRKPRIARTHVRRCPPPARVRLDDWNQLQGSSRHRGHSPVAIEPPLRTLWARPVGGHLHGGAPIVNGGRVYVTIPDFADGSAAAVAAFDARTGAEIWRHRTGVSIRNAAAYADGLVIAASQDGTVHALDAGSGTPRWTAALGVGLERNFTVLNAAPTVHDGIVYIGVHRNFVALDVATGRKLWQVVPSPNEIWQASNASVAAADGVLLAAFARGATDGIAGYHPTTGAELWRLGAPLRLAVGIQASPVVGDGLVFIGNSAGQVSALRPRTGEQVWAHQLFDHPSYWDYAVTATPALADGTLFVPTQYDKLVALDAATGAEKWSVDADPSAIHTSHARSAARAFTASPVVAGGVLWLGGADGRLRALAPQTGAELWSADLGVPIVSGVTPAGEVLYVGTYDGTLRALVSGEVDEFRSHRRSSERRSTAGWRRVWLALLAVVCLLGATLLLRSRSRR